MKTPDIAFPPFRLDTAGLRLSEHGLPVRLRPKALALLCHLAERPGTLVTQDELQTAVWPETPGTEVRVKVCVRELRQALRDDAAKPRFIETVYSKGYRFIGEAQPSPDTQPASAPVGRTAELGRLRARLARALLGRRQTVLVTGEPGVGKSFLLSAFVDETRTPLVLRAQSTPAVQEPHGLLLEAFGSAARTGHGELVARTLRKFAPTWLDRLPCLSDPGERELLSRAAVGAGAARLQREFFDALDALAESRGLLFVLEDLQHTDRSSVALLAALARREVSARSLLVATISTRDFGPAHALWDVGAEPSLGERVDLGRWSAQDVESWLALRAGAPPHPNLAALVFRRTEGLPLFAEHFITALEAADEGGGGLDALARHVPDTLARAIERELDGLSEEERSVVAVAGLIGRPFPAELVAAMLDWPSERVLGVLQGLLLRGGFLRADGVDEQLRGLSRSSFSLAHGLLAEVASHTLDPERKGVCQGRLARCLAREARRPDELAHRIADLFRRAHDVPRALQWFRRSIALDLRRGDYSAALAAVEEAVTLLDSAGGRPQRSLRLALSEQRGLVLRGLGRADEAREELTRLVGEARKARAVDWTVRGLLQLADEHRRTAPERWLSLSEEAVRLAASCRNRTLAARARAVLGQCRYALFGWSPAHRRAARDAMKTAVHARDSAGIGLVAASHVYFQNLSSHYAAADAAARVGSAAALGAGDAASYFQCELLRSHVLTRWGRWADALAVISPIAQLARANGNSAWEVLALQQRALVHVEALDPSQGERLAEEAVQRAQELRFSLGEALARIVRARALAGKGAFEPAYAELAWLRQQEDALHLRLCSRIYIRQTQAWVALGEETLGAAEEHAREVIRLASGPGERGWMADGYRVLAEVAGRGKHELLATRHVRTAVALAEAAEAPVVLWGAHETGRRLARDGGHPSAAAKHALAARESVALLLEQLEGAAELRRSFLASPRVIATLGRAAAMSAPQLFRFDSSLVRSA